MTVAELIEVLETCDGALPVRVALVVDGEARDVEDGLHTFNDEVLLYEQGYDTAWRKEVASFTKTGE